MSSALLLYAVLYVLLILPVGCVLVVFVSPFVVRWWRRLLVAFTSSISVPLLVVFGLGQHFHDPVAIVAGGIPLALALTGLGMIIRADYARAKTAERR